MKQATSALLVEAIRLLRAAQREMTRGDAALAVGYAYLAVSRATTAALREAGEEADDSETARARFRALFVRTRRIAPAYVPQLAALRQIGTEAMEMPEIGVSPEQVEDAVNCAAAFLVDLERTLRTPPAP